VSTASKAKTRVKKGDAEEDERRRRRVLTGN
jgi:hypothetical protein